MNKRAIWIIIILMSVALVGTALIQVYWFKDSITLQESRFDSNVFQALNKVAERLASDENATSLEILKYNPKSAGFLQKESVIFMQEAGAIQRNSFRSQLNNRDSLLKNPAVADFISSKNDWQQTRFLYEIQGLAPSLMDIEDRIDPPQLYEIMQKEIANQGIDMNFQMGVYSNKSKNFVIVNGNYVAGFDDEVVNVTDAGLGKQKSLFNSDYQVALFTDDTNASPAMLKVYFPSKKTWLWSSLLPTLLGTILFTGLTLFSFAYTINVIFRQKKISEMKTDFINNMTHEFKTPIATISLAADSITSPMVMGQETKVRRFAEIIKQENKRMLNQVEKVLQMALIDKSEFQLNISQIDLHSLIDVAVDNANLQVQKRNGNIKKDLQAKPSVIEADQTHVASILSNLLDNANKYSQESPNITLHTRNVGEGIEVIVEDNGIGMTKEAKKHIFDKFYRVSTGNVHDVKGFGLGLSYVKAIMDAHHGQIDVKSELGKGSSFILYFPSKHNKNSAT